jgi:phosphotriesterase-related protein
MPGLAYLFDRFVPRLRGAIGDTALQTVLVTNPARWLSWEPAR